MKEWFMLTGAVESIDEINRVALNNVHPSRIMDSWVLQFVLKGKRTLLFKSIPRRIQQGEFSCRRPAYHIMDWKLMIMTLSIFILKCPEKKSRHRSQWIQPRLSFPFPIHLHMN